jgi:hypothetical protein
MTERLTTRDVCRIYKKTRKTILFWRDRSGMPYHKIGAECFFVPEELLAWERAHGHNLPRSVTKTDIHGHTVRSPGGVAA